jgi:hypothetical protein
MGDGAYYDSPSNLRHYSKIYRVVDRWVGRVPDASVVINAGWLTEDPKQGVVYVVAYDPVTSNPTYDIRNGAHLTPVKTGGLRVVGADGTLVKLLSEDGVEWVFNATEGRFVSPHEEPLPTASPVPTPRPTPVILPVERVSIDARIDGNSVTTWGSVEGCAEVAIGASATVDLVVEGLPAVGGSAMGITGFDLKLGYDPALLRVAALDVNQLLGVRPNSFPSSLGDPLPDADGSFRVTVVDFGPNSGDPATISETTGGILVRVTFAAVAAGVSDLTLNDTGIIDTRNDAHRVAEEVGARIAVGLPCP